MQEKSQKWINMKHRRQVDVAGELWAHMLRQPKDKLFLTKSSMGWLWHRRLGHVGMKQLNKLIKHDLVRGLKDVTFEKDKLCSACQARKQVGNTHSKKSMMSTSKAFELLHIDLFGSTTYTSIGGNKYGFVIVDYFTRYT